MRRNSLGNWEMQECQAWKEADACITVDGQRIQRECINVAAGLGWTVYPRLFPRIQLPRDGCIKITDEQNSRRAEGKKLKQICTCSTNGCDPMQFSGIFIHLNIFLDMDAYYLEAS